MSSKRKKKGAEVSSVFLNINQIQDYDDFSEEFDDASEESYQVKKKSKKRSNKAQDKREKFRKKFLDTEVEVEDASEMERPSKRGKGLPTMQQKESLYYHDDELRRKNTDMKNKIDDIEKRFYEKNVAGQEAEDSEEEDGLKSKYDSEEDQISDGQLDQRRRLPAVTDPKLW